MKTKYFLLYTICICICNFGSSQIYDPIKFSNYTPLWSHTHAPSKIPKIAGSWIPLEQIISNDPYLIDNGIIYNVYNIVQGNAFMGGYYLEALEIKTGTMLWDDVFYSETVGKRRYAVRPEIQGDTLALIIFHEYDKSDTLLRPMWSNSIPKRINYDKLTGKILSTTLNTQKDINAKKLGAPFPYSVSSLMYQGINFNYITHQAHIATTNGQNSIWYSQFILNDEGLAIDSNQLYVPVRYNTVLDGLNYIDNNTIFCFNLSERTQGAAPKIYDLSYHYMDRQLHISQTGNMNILNTGDVNRFIPIYANSEFIITRSDSLAQDPNYLKTKYISLFNKSGQLLENINVKALNLLASDSKIMSAAFMLKDGNKKKVLFCIHSRKNNTLDFYLSDGLGKYTLKKSLKINPEMKTAFYLNKMEIIENNVLCHISYRENATGLYEVPIWSSWFMMRGSDFNITTSNNDPQEEITHSAYPNPSNQELNISNINDLNDYQLGMHDMLSHEVKLEFKQQKGHISIDTNYLASGIYIFTIKNKKSGKTSSLKVIITE